MIPSVEQEENIKREGRIAENVEAVEISCFRVFRRLLDKQEVEGFSFCFERRKKG